MEELNGGTPQQDKKANGKLIGGIIAVVAVLAIGVGIFAFNMQNKSVFKKLTGTPEEIINTAIANTNARCLEEQAEVKDKMGITQLNKIQENEASELNFNVGFQGISGIEDADLVTAYVKDAGLTGTFQKTKANDKVNGKLSVNQSGIELLSASIYKDGDELGVNVPKILDAPYAVKLDSLLEDYKNSALFKLTGGQEISEEELNEVTEVFNAFGEYMTGAMNLSSNEEFMSKTKALQTEFIKDAKLKENGKEKVVLQDGSKTEWTVYSGTLTSEQLMDFVSKEMDLIMSLDFAKNYFDVIAKESGYTVEEMREEMNELFEGDDTVTIDIDFFVDDSYFRGVNLGIKEDGEHTADVTIKYTGAKYLLDGIEMGINASDDTVGMELTFSQNLGEKSDLLKQNLAFVINEDGNSTGKINYEYSYDSKAKEDNLKVDCDLDFGRDARMNYTATGTKVVNDNEVSTNLSKASFKVADEQQKINLDFSLGYGIKAIKAADIKIDKTGVKYLFEMSEQELASAVQAIQSNVQSFAYGLM